VEEKSHKDEMRAALRGDFERMRRRQVGEPAPPPAPVPLPVNEQSTAAPNEATGSSWLDRVLGRG